MKITAEALSQINNSQSRMRIALAFKMTERWIIQCIKDNKSDGFLTKTAVIRKIQEETGLKESEILQEEDIVMHKRVRVGRKSKQTF